MSRRCRIFGGFILGVIFFSRLALATGSSAPSVVVLLAAASDTELQPLIAKLDSPQIETRAAWQFWIGTFAGKRVVLTRTEGDPLNAAAATTLAIRRYSPQLVVTFGTARAHDPALQPGDLVISKKFAAFDGLVSPVVKIGGGSDPLTWRLLPHLSMESGAKEVADYFFPADQKALAIANKLTGPRGPAIEGVLGSAAQVNQEADRVAWIRKEWSTSCEDGESAHIAGCAKLLGVPVIGLRVINGAEGDASAVALKFLEALK